HKVLLSITQFQSIKKNRNKNHLPELFTTFQIKRPVHFLVRVFVLTVNRIALLISQFFIALLQVHGR
ncbi:MAG: hypothetical protein C0623_03950, partial [Desulfuromonas sp.]